jgi:hypothetical protein
VLCLKIKHDTIAHEEDQRRQKMVTALKSCYGELNAKDHHPTLHVLDNEGSCEVKYYIVSKRADIQFIKSCNHRVDAAKHGCKDAK